MGAPAALVGVADLSRAEVADLGRLEAIVADWLGGSIPCGRAMNEIFDRKLYRPRHWASYCQEIWHLEESYCYMLRAAAREVDRLIKDGCETLPITEYLVRPLLKVESETQRTEVWQSAVKAAQGRKIRTRHVEQAIEKILGRPIDANRGEVDDATAAVILKMPKADQAALLQKENDRAATRNNGSRVVSPVEHFDLACKALATARKHLDGFTGGEAFANRVDKIRADLLRLDRATLRLSKGAPYLQR